MDDLFASIISVFLIVGFLSAFLLYLQLSRSRRSVHFQICILESSYENSNSPLKDLDPYRDLESYFRDHEPVHDFTRVFIQKAKASQQIRTLANEGFDVFINLCDGAWDEDRAGFEVVQNLEKFKLAFTGANSIFYEPSKELQKMMCYYMEVSTPKYNFAFSDEDIDEADKWLNYPMIVKHYNGYDSIGMTSKSKVSNRDELFEMARMNIREFRGALIEEYIEGRELTVLIAENPDDECNPLVFTPVECVFLEGETFKHFDLKYKDLDNISWVPCSDESLSNKLKEMTKSMFKALRGNGFARADFRVNAEGEAFFLEMNPNCGIFYRAPEDNPNSLGSADFILNQEMGHIKFTEHIIKCALKQAEKRLKPAEVRFKPETGYGLFATRDIKKGEVVNQHEGRPHYIVSKSYVESEWKDELQKKWFTQYAFPISESVWTIWSDDPLEWNQINHSCDPNTWVKGLNLFARRDIPKGEQIAIEYATYCCEPMAEFECNCKAVNCRKLIKAKDYLLPFMEEYEGHTTDFVVSKRKEGLAKAKHQNGV